MLPALLLVVVTTLFLFLKLRDNKRKNEFWKILGVPFIDVSKIASSLDLLFGLKTENDIDIQVYEQMGSQKFCGIVEAGTPLLLVKDLDLAKDILIKDFDHFTDRPVLFRASKSKILLKMLPSQHGAEWRGTRISVSPTLTTGKIRRLMEYFNGCGVEWVAALKKKGPSELHEWDVLASSGQYAIDVIASAVFGLKAGSIQDPNSPFLKYSKQLFGDTSWKQLIKQNLAYRAPSFFKLLNMNPVNEEALQFLDDILSNTLKARESGQVNRRDDFIQFLVDPRRQIANEDDEKEELSTLEKEALLKDKLHKNYLNDDDIVKGQGFIFFFAGYHGIAMSMTYATNVLAHFPEIQEKVYKELEGNFDDDGNISYENMNSLVYMDKFISEILRFNPITPRLPRITTKDYNRPDVGLHLPKGTMVMIPLARFHQDPKYFSNPEKFDPENFTTENKAKRHPYAYMPFGIGPRNCIGNRFALVELKTAIAHLVYNFIIEPTKVSRFPVKTKLIGQAVLIDEKVEVKLTPRK